MMDVELGVSCLPFDCHFSLSTVNWFSGSLYTPLLIAANGNLTSSFAFLGLVLFLSVPLTSNILFSNVSTNWSNLKVLPKSFVSGPVFSRLSFCILLSYCSGLTCICYVSHVSLYFFGISFVFRKFDFIEGNNIPVVIL